MRLVLQVFFAVAFSAIGIANAQMAFPDITKASGAVKRVFSVIDRVPAILPNTASGQLYSQSINRVYSLGQGARCDSSDLLA